MNEVPDNSARTAAPPAGDAAGDGVAAAATQFWRRQVLYPNTYAWFVLFASLDIVFTWVILHLGGRELNGIADWVIRSFGLPGLAAFKFVLVLLVVAICEIVGRRNGGLGMKLAQWAVILNVFPVTVAVIHLVRITIVHITIGPTAGPEGGGAPL